MAVHVLDGLAGHRPDVETNVEPIGTVFFPDNFTQITQGGNQREPKPVEQFVDGGQMLPGNQKGMAFIDGKLVVKPDQSGLIEKQILGSGGTLTEGTFFNRVLGRATDVCGSPASCRMENNA